MNDRFHPDRWIGVTLPTVFFSYHLKPDADHAAFEAQVLRDVAPDALSADTVEHWALHRTVPWPGSSDDSPDYVCVADVADVALWAQQASDGIEASHAALNALVSRIEMSVTTDVVADDHSGDRP